MNLHISFLNSLYCTSIKVLHHSDHRPNNTSVYMIAIVSTKGMKSKLKKNHKLSLMYTVFLGSTYV
jgi:hypothetical protein